MTRRPWRASGLCSSAEYIVGTPSKIVTFSRPIISRAAPASNRGSRVRVEPLMTDAFMPQVRPKTWNSGRHPMITSPGPAVSSVVVVTSAFVYRFAWVSSAPFGTPVVPDVYRMTASSSSAAFGPVRHRLPVAQQRPRVRLRHPHDLRAAIGRALGRLVRQRVPGDDDRGARVAEIVRDLPALQQRVHRHDRGADGEAAVEEQRDTPPRSGASAPPGRRGPPRPRAAGRPPGRSPAPAPCRSAPAHPAARPATRPLLPGHPAQSRPDLSSPRLLSPGPAAHVPHPMPCPSQPIPVSARARFIPCRAPRHCQ